MIYFRHYIEAYDKFTGELSMIEDGAYERLLRHYYKKEQPLPLEASRVHRVARAISQEERDAVDFVLCKFFTKAADGWHNERADHEIKVAQVARANGSMNGRGTDGDTEPSTGSGTTRRTTRATTPKATEASKPLEQAEDHAEDHGGGQIATTSKPLSLSTLQPLNLPPNPLPRAARSAPQTAEVWSAYSEAYTLRYKQPPVRNARVNTALKRFVEAVGATEAPAVAAFFVTHQRKAYFEAGHPVTMLVRDAEKLRTEWAQGTQITATAAAQADRTQATGSVFAKLIEESEAAQDMETEDGQWAWWRDEMQIGIRGNAEGVVPIEGQGMDEYQARVYAALGPGPWLEEASPQLIERVQHYQSAGINPPSQHAARRQPTPGSR